MPPTDPASAFVGLGSNLQDPSSQLRAAIGLLAALPQTSVERCSSLYRSAPIGNPDQPDFVNAVCLLRTCLGPHALMQHLLALETAQGRVRTQPGGPRVLDLDLLLYAGADGIQQVISSPGLELPHPRLHGRAFVLYPLHEIAPGLEIRGRGPVSALLADCQGQIIERLADTAAGTEKAGTSRSDQ